MTLKIIIEGKSAGRQLVHGLLIAQARITRTIAATVKEASAEFLRRGKQDIRAAGKFGKRWTDGLRAEVNVTPALSTITIFHSVPYYRVFEFGATIKGRPLLWIPLSFARDAQKVRARDYPGGLFRVDRSGKAPLLLSIADKKPKYFGKKSVRIPRKFHLRDIARSVGNRLREIYSKHFRSDTGGV